MKKKIAFVFGTRPEAIKMAPFVQAVNGSVNYESSVILTGQHPTMAKQVLSWFDLEADEDLSIDRSSSSLNSLNSQIISQIGDVLSETEPDLVVVQGDTASAFAGAFAAFNLQIPVAHLEAGLRTNDIYSPYPEEAYRQMLSRIAELHMCPTKENKANLLAEGVDPKKIMVTGNTVVDAFRVVGTGNSSRATLEFLPEQIRESDLVLVTSHRRENLGDKMSEIAEAVKEIAIFYPRLQFVVPMHPNPTVRERLLPVLENLGNVFLLEPLDYPEFISVLAHSKLVLTDSGGVQEEAPILGVPALVMRENTERPEGVSAGGVVLVGADRNKIVSTMKRLLNNDVELSSMAKSTNPYGDGQAASRCLSFIDEYFVLGSRQEEFVNAG